ncbi:CG5391 [Drosophila busckii]|uniref:CG5391 n=1 Tax=Drosophila busckii TaxID=30019 RepID=A0A0M4F609_DROBS|nr:uncharacterized protein LOC108602546 [Drosophila busckii]ALC47412.1 CG5391 [Drosophila busckii]
MSTANCFSMLLFGCCFGLLLIAAEAKPRWSRDVRNGLVDLSDLSAAGSELSVAYAPAPQEPMVLNDNYNVIMPDFYDQHPAESMQLQNFANFYEAEMNPGNDLGMDESQFLSSTPVRAPQPVSPQEQRVRKHLSPVDISLEKRAQLNLKKGDTKARGSDFPEWDQFDY